MLINSIKATNSRAHTLDIPLESDVQNFVYIKSIDGLGPVKATIVSSSFSNMDGAYFHTAHREPRNIVINLGLNSHNPLYTAHELRSNLYNFFMSKTPVILEFIRNNAITGLPEIFEIRGIIETCEPDIFTKEPAITVSIFCFDPDFFDATEFIVEGVTIDNSTIRTPVNYTGSVGTGPVFSITLPAATNRVRLWQQAPGNPSAYIDLNDIDLIAGDILQISSMRNNKHITRIRGGVSSSWLHRMSSISRWMELFPGNNATAVALGNAGSYIVDVPWSLSYYRRFGGL